MIRTLTVPRCLREQRRKVRERHSPSEERCHLGAACGEVEGAADPFHYMAGPKGTWDCCPPVYTPKLTCVGLCQHVFSRPHSFYFQTLCFCLSVCQCIMCGSTISFGYCVRYPNSHHTACLKQHKNANHQ